jgi:hypothetical protein
MGKTLLLLDFKRLKQQVYPSIKQKLFFAGSRFVKAIVNKDMLFAVISAAIFLVVFHYGYKQIPKHFYEYRDDGIITMSHAKNLADYGSIGINPSGERVEGYSAPGQFLSYYIFYKLSGISYKAYSNLQTLLATFLLGFIFIKFFKSNYLVGLIMSFISALLLAKNPSFLGWHGSGMENAVIHVLFLASIYLLYKMYTEAKINYYYTIVLFLAAVARIESIYYIFPLLVIFSLFWYFKNKDFSGVYFSLIILGVWGVFNGIRYIYFGDFLPNTAYGQQISMTDKIKRLLQFSPKYYAVLASVSREIMYMHFGYLVALALPLVYFVKRSKEFLFLILLLLCMVVASYLNPYFFGRSRIEPTRTTTHLAVVVVLLVSFIISKLCIKKHTYWVLPLFFVTVLLFSGVNAVKPYYLGWESQYFNTIRKEFLKLKKQHDIARPTICNVDLGLMSWYKEFNIVDLGRLGNPVVARLIKDRKRQSLADYIFDLTAPDIIELHDSPARSFHYLFKDKRFRGLYVPVREERSPWLKKHAKKFPKVMKGIWIRRDIVKGSSSRERLFLDKLQSDLSIDTIKEELAICSQENRANAFTYAARTVYRFIPELVSQGTYDDVIELFRTSGASDFDIALLSGRQDRNWYKQMIAYLRDYNIQ